MVNTRGENEGIYSNENMQDGSDWIPRYIIHRQNMME